MATVTLTVVFDETLVTPKFMAERVAACEGVEGVFSDE